MTDDDLTTSDVLADEEKNFCNIYGTNADDDDNVIPLFDSLYFTETEFVDLINDEDINDLNNFTILSLNIANLFSKLNSFKVFLNNVSTQKNRPDVIILVETHIPNEVNAGYTENELKNILPGYNFFHKGRALKKGGGVGIFSRKSLKGEVELFADVTKKVNFIEESFENITIRIPELIPTKNGSPKKDLIVTAIYRQPNNNNNVIFCRELKLLLTIIDKKGNKIIKCHSIQ